MATITRTVEEKAEKQVQQEEYRAPDLNAFQEWLGDIGPVASSSIMAIITCIPFAVAAWILTWLFP